MKLLSVEIHNCFRYGSLNNTFDFLKFPLVLISGKNGAGKSSIFESVCYALFERTVRWSSPHEKIVRRGQERGYIRLAFEKDGNIFEVIRGYNRHQARPEYSLKCIKGQFDIEYSNAKEMNREVYRIIGIDFDAFKNSVFFGQSDFDRLVNINPAERLEVLTNFLNLGTLDKCLEATTYRLKKIKSDIANIDFALEAMDKPSIRTGLNSLFEMKETLTENIQVNKDKFESLNQLRAKLDKLQTAMVKAKRNIELAQESIKSKRKMLDHLKTSTGTEEEIDIVSLEKKVIVNVAEYNKIEGMEKRLGEAQEKEKEDLEELGSLREKWRVIKSRLEHIRKKDICTECGRKYNQEVRQRLMKDDKSSLGKITKTARELIKGIKNKRKEIKSLKEAIKTIQELENPDIILEKIEKYKLLKHSQIEMVNLEEEIKRKESAIQREEETIKAIETEGFKEGRLGRLHDRMLEIKGDLSSKEASLVALEKDITTLKEKALEVKKLEITRESLCDRISPFVFLERMFSKSGGLRQVIVENVLPVLNEKINYYLESITTEAISVDFTTGTKTKKGEFKNKLDINIVTPNGVADFASYSGGEKQAIILAMGLGFAELASDSVNADCDFLLLDEVFAPFDSAGRSRVLNLLSSLQRKFKNVLIISHLAELKNQLPHMISVKRVKGLSMISSQDVED